MLRRRSLGQCSWVNVWLSIMWVGGRAYGYRWTCLVLVTRRVLHALVSFPRAFCFRMQCSCDVQRRVLPNAYDYVVLCTESLQGVVRGVATTKLVVTTQGGVVTTPNTHFVHVFWGYNLTTPLVRPFSGRRILFKCPLHTARCHARCDF